MKDAVNNYCKQTRTWTKFHIKETGSDLHMFKSIITSFQIALELKGNGKVCPRSGDQKLDPEACLVWREGHHIGPINGLKRIITLWLKTWRYIRRKSTRTSKNAVKRCAVTKEREKENNPSHTNSQQNHFLQIHTLFHIQKPTDTPQGHFSQAHMNAPIPSSHVLMETAKKKPCTDLVFGVEEEEEEEKER